MSCLDNLIGVRGCGSAEREFYVNDLTGINIPDFDKAITTEHTNASAALTDIVSFATKYVEQSISSHLSTKYQLKSFIENNVVGYYYEDKQEIAAQPTYLTGYEIRIDSTPYLNLFIQGLNLFVKTTGTVNVLVYDLIQGKLLNTIPVSAVSGEIVSLNDLDLSYYTNKQRLHLFIGYASTFESYKTSYVSPFVGMNVNENCNNNCSGTYRNSFVYFRAAKILASNPKTNAYLEGNDYGSGLSLNYSLQCSFREVMCSARNLFALAILYKSGELIMKELKNSKRLTGVVAVYAKNHDELMKEYQAEYSNQMADVLLNMSLPDSVCFSCTPSVKTRVALP
jgi:hypothetical protein